MLKGVLPDAGERRLGQAVPPGRDHPLGAALSANRACICGLQFELFGLVRDVDSRWAGVLIGWA